MFFCSVQIISGTESQSKFQVFIVFSGCHIGGISPGGPSKRLDSIILRETFRRISQLLENACTHIKLEQTPSLIIVFIITVS